MRTFNQVKSNLMYTSPLWAWEQHAVFFEFSYILDGDFVFPAPSVSQCPTAVGGPGPGAVVHMLGLRHKDEYFFKRFKCSAPSTH